MALPPRAVETQSVMICFFFLVFVVNISEFVNWQIVNLLYPPATAALLHQYPNQCY